jgi:F-type H+-transporting ATPase subunit delta
VATKTGDRVVQGYARALFDVADAEGDLDRVEDELYRFGRAVRSAPDLGDALADAALPVDRKKGILQELLGDRASRHTVALLGFLLEQGKGKDLPKIVDALSEVAASMQRKRIAEVRTAISLGAEQRTKLQEALSKAAGTDVELKFIVDPAVVGGAVARVGDQVFDGSVRRRLELARERLGRVR